MEKDGKERGRRKVRNGWHGQAGEEIERGMEKGAERKKVKMRTDRGEQGAVKNNERR